MGKKRLFLYVFCFLLFTNLFGFYLSHNLFFFLLFYLQFRVLRKKIFGSWFSFNLFFCYFSYNFHIVFSTTTFLLLPIYIGLFFSNSFFSKEEAWVENVVLSPAALLTRENYYTLILLFLHIILMCLCDKKIGKKKLWM